MKRQILLIPVLIQLILFCAGYARAQEGMEYFPQTRCLNPFQTIVFHLPQQVPLTEPRPFGLLAGDETLFAFLALPRIQSVRVSDSREAFRRQYNRPRVNETRQVRQMWEEAFGMDVWYPYFKAKEVESWVKKRVSVRVFSLKGEFHYEKNRVLYSFAKSW